MKLKDIQFKRMEIMMQFLDILKNNAHSAEDMAACVFAFFDVSQGIFNGSLGQFESKKEYEMERMLKELLEKLIEFKSLYERVFEENNEEEI